MGVMDSRCGSNPLTPTLAPTGERERAALRGTLNFVARMSEREASEIRVRFDASRPPRISLRSSGLLA